MKKRPIFAIFSLSFLLTGCSASEIFGSVKGFFSGLFGNKNQEEPKTEEPKEEPKEEDVSFKEALENTDASKNYSYKYYYYSNRKIDTNNSTSEPQESQDQEDPRNKTASIGEEYLEHALKRDNNKTLVKYKSDSDYSEYGEVLDGNAYVYAYTQNSWKYSMSIPTEKEYYAPSYIHFRLENIFSEEASETIEITQTDSTYKITGKGENSHEDFIQACLANYPAEEEAKIREAFASSGLENYYEFVVKGKYIQSFLVNMIDLESTETEGGTEYKITVTQFSKVYSDYEKTVVERPEGIEVPPQN